MFTTKLFFCTQVGSGPRDDDPAVKYSDTAITFTSTGGDNPGVMSYTLTGYLSVDAARSVVDEGGIVYRNHFLCCK